MKLISISGLDGSGKTLQINYLKDYLEDHGKTIYYFHAIKFSIANKIFGVLRRKKSKINSGAKTSAGMLLIFLRKIVLVIDAMRFKRLHKKLKKQGIDYVLTDRFFYDQMINIVYLSKGSELDDNRWWQKLTESNIVVPDHALFLEVTPHTIFLRKKQIEQGRKYLGDKYKLYEYYANTRNLQRIDGEQSKNEVLEDIKKAINIT